MKKGVFVCSVCVAIGVMGCAWAAGVQKRQSAPKPLSEEAKERYERLAREWMVKLWTNDYSQIKASVFPHRMSEDRPWREGVMVKLNFHMEGKKNSQHISIEFYGRDSTTVSYIDNSSYKKYGPTREEYKEPTAEDNRPRFITDEQARIKAGEYARMLGVTNLLDISCFMLRSPAYVENTWHYDFTANINGYSSLYGVSVGIADTPRMDLQHWHNVTLDIPKNLPTNVVLTSEQARVKAEGYLKCYFPMKDLVPQLTYATNVLEYSSPNYNYIRPSDDSGFSSYVPQKDELSLIWKNYFDKPHGLGFQVPVIIYVDAATGEMLGGAD